MLIKTENSYGYWWFYYNCVFFCWLLFAAITQIDTYLYMCVYFTFSTVYDSKEQTWPEN